MSIKRIRALAGLMENMGSPQFTHAELMLLWEAVTQFADNFPEQEDDGTFVDADETGAMGQGELARKQAMAQALRAKLDSYARAATS